MSIFCANEQHILKNSQTPCGGCLGLVHLLRLSAAEYLTAILCQSNGPLYRLTKSYTPTLNHLHQWYLIIEAAFLPTTALRVDMKMILSNSFNIEKPLDFVFTVL